jgi:hypothetical protein
VLVISDGQRVPATGPGLIGRNPPRRDPAVTVIAVNDPSQSISKTHLEYGLADGRLWVKDRGSTNGSRWLRPGQPPVPLAPGEAVFVSPGETIEFGQCQCQVEWGSA